MLLFYFIGIIHKTKWQQNKRTVTVKDKFSNQIVRLFQVFSYKKSDGEKPFNIIQSDSNQMDFLKLCHLQFGRINRSKLLKL